MSGAPFPDPLNLLEQCRQCLFHVAIEGLEDGLVLVDPAGRIFHVNRRAERLLESRRDRLLGSAMTRALSDGVLASFWEAASRDLATTTAADLVLSSGIMLRASVSACRAESGALLGTALLLRDVSRERRVTVELSAAVAARLVQLSGTLEPTPALERLTRREVEILRLLAAGQGNAAIARRLRVAPSTIATHVKHLYPKIGARNRAQATAWALANGLATAPAARPVATAAAAPAHGRQAGARRSRPLR